MNDEWLCQDCNTVYPGPPQKGFMCVICPSCGGNTAPRTTVEITRLKERIKELELYKADAIRYRLLRNGGNHDYRLVKYSYSGLGVFEKLNGEQLDRIMDKALEDHKNSWMTQAVGNESANEVLKHP